MTWSSACGQLDQVVADVRGDLRRKVGVVKLRNSTSQQSGSGYYVAILE